MDDAIGEQQQHMNQLKQAYDQAEMVYPEDLVAQHDVTGPWDRVDGLVGITADLLVIDTEHNPQAVRDALSARFGPKLRCALFKTEVQMQKYKEHPQKGQIGIKKMNCLERLREGVRRPDAMAGVLGFLGCAADFLR
jgi:hypothetical protein